MPIVLSIWGGVNDSSFNHTLTDISDYFFLDKDHTIPRLPFMLNSFDDIIKSKNNKGE